MIEENVKSLTERLSGGNGCGEKITLVAATKTRTPEEIGRALRAGITDIGENKVQEFCAKYDEIGPCRRHFIGRLQCNKVKYLIGRTALIHSVDRDGLALEISRRAETLGVVQDVLIQINIGGEETKGGYPPEEGLTALKRISALGGLSVKGFMAMLPDSDDTELLSRLCTNMRGLFERARDLSPDIVLLSMGMSGDWELCVEHGANMIRLGTAIFGERNVFPATSAKKRAY